MTRDTTTRFVRARTILVVLAAGAPLAWGGVTAQAALLPPQNPPKSLAPTEAFLEACDNASNDAAACVKAALTQIDADRAAEHVGPMSLPTDFTQLTTDEQIFVVTNLERVDRGAAPLGGLATTLDRYAQAGAASGTDPAFPPYAGYAGSNWSGGSNIFVADQGWMYNDGPGGINLGCTSTTKSGCWGHRDNILGAWSAPALMGAGQTTKGEYGGSVTQLFLSDDTTDTPFFTWADVTTHLAVGLSATSLTLRARPGTSQTATLDVSASGERMDVTLAWSEPNPAFSLSRTSCDLAAGSECVVHVTFSPAGPSVLTGDLRVSGPNGTQEVAVRGVSGGAWVVSATGRVTAVDVANYGPKSGRTKESPVVGVASSPGGLGYWLVTAAGRVYPYGSARDFGSFVGGATSGGVIGLAPDENGHGYWIASATGRVQNFGTAKDDAPKSGHLPAGPIVAIAANPTGQGYWLVSATGHVTGYGGATVVGPHGGRAASVPVTAFAPTPDGQGYWLLAASGHVMNFGDAASYGSASAVAAGTRAIGLAATPDGQGYWVLAANGQVAAFGDARSFAPDRGPLASERAAGIAAARPRPPVP